jgi:ADP-ribose pyrophosphatase YjhB (NUDIX family)
MPQKLKLLVKLSAKNGVSTFDDGAAAGTIILEPDGRVCIVHPTNKFVGYTSTFPKGTRDHNEDLRTTAIRETYEETGLLVVLINYPGVCFDENDPGMHNGVFVKLDRASGLTYYYLAKRVAGSPSDMGWESQAVSLVPVSELRAQHIGKRFVTPTNWDEKPKSSDRSLTPADYLSQDEKILDYIIDQADIIETLL